MGAVELEGPEGAHLHVEGAALDGPRDDGADTGDAERLVDHELQGLALHVAPAAAQRREVHEEAQQVEAEAGDGGGEEDGCERLRRDRQRARQHVLHQHGNRLLPGLTKALQWGQTFIALSCDARVFTHVHADRTRRGFVITNRPFQAAQSGG